MNLQTKRKRRFVTCMLTTIVLGCILCVSCKSDSDSALPSLTVTPKSLQFTGQANITRTVNITTDADWSVNIQNVPWLSIDYASGNKNATVNFTTNSENDNADSRYADILIRASNESGSVDSVLHVEQISLYEHDCIAELSNQDGSRLEMAYGFGCRIRTGGNTSYFKYQVYEKNYYESNIKGDKNKIEQELNNGVRVSPQYDNAEIVYKDCNPNNDYILALMPYTSSGNRGPLKAEEMRTQGNTRPALASISNVAIENGKYVWEMKKENSCNDYFIYVYAGKSEIAIFKEDRQVADADKRGVTLAWELSKELASDEEDQTTDIKGDGRDMLFSASLNDGSLEFDAESTDRYLLIATWARNGNKQYSGVISEVLYEISNGALVPIADVDLAAQKNVGPYTQVNPTTMSFDYSGSTQKLNVTSNEEWTCSSNQSWCSVTPTSGSNNGTISVTCTQYSNTDASRTATITVTGKESGDVSVINVTQSPKSNTVIGLDGYGDDKDLDGGGGSVTYTLSVSPTSVSMASGGESRTVTVSGNDSWTVSSSQSWCTVSPTSGSNSGTIVITTSNNSSTSSRTATVTVKGSNSGKTLSVSVSQNGGTVIGRDDYGNDKSL